MSLLDTSAAATRMKTVVFDSPVGAWTLRSWEPAPDLRPAVVGLWATTAQTVAFREKVIPRETVELMVNFGGRQLVHWSDRPHSPQPFRRVWVSGLQTECLDIESPSAAQLIAASLHPAHAGALLGVAGRELRGRVVELDDVLSRTATDLADRLEETPSVVGRFLLLEDFLRDRLRRQRRSVPAAIRAIERICDAGGRLSAATLRAEIGCSARYLETQLAEHVGLSPKQLAKLVRFSRAIECVRVAEVVDWAEVAIDCGYYDQSHFYRDFGRFTGTTPGEFLAQRDPSSQALLIE